VQRHLRARHVDTRPLGSSGNTRGNGGPRMVRQPILVS
jgi:hypothetical protein